MKKLLLILHRIFLIAGLVFSIIGFFPKLFNEIPIHFTSIFAFVFIAISLILFAYSTRIKEESTETPEENMTALMHGTYFERRKYFEWQKNILKKIERLDLNKPEDLECLKHYIEFKDSCISLTALMRLRPKEDEKLIIRYTKHHNKDIRMVAIEILPNGNEELLEDIKNTDPDMDIQWAVKKALKDI